MDLILIVGLSIAVLVMIILLKMEEGKLRASEKERKEAVRDLNRELAASRKEREELRDMRWGRSQLVNDLAIAREAIVEVEAELEDAREVVRVEKEKNVELSTILVEVRDKAAAAVSSVLSGGPEKWRSLSALDKCKQGVADRDRPIPEEVIQADNWSANPSSRDISNRDPLFESHGNPLDVNAPPQ